ncbi:hypothetical protein FRC20_001413 [Serendipita sp. 405]|nr:hypothetical protein FRC20_001413 [Serendipita sp. 405]
MVDRSDDGVFDWFKSFKDIEDYFGTLISDKSASILMLGCGNSTLSEEMYEAGYTNIVNIDYSAVVIEKMKLRNEDRPLMRCNFYTFKLHYENDQKLQGLKWM